MKTLDDAGSAQEMFGVWNTKHQGWVRGSDGNVLIWEKADDEGMVSTGGEYVLKELFICSDEPFEERFLCLQRQRFRNVPSTQ